MIEKKVQNLKQEKNFTIHIDAHYYHGATIRTGIVYKKCSCYMRDSACNWLIVQMLKYFKIVLNTFEFSDLKEVVES